MKTKLTTDTFITRDMATGTVVTRATGEEQEFTFDTIRQGLVQKNTLVTPKGGSQMVKDLFMAIWEDSTRQNDTIAVEFDKQTLLFLLSQTGCEGIRITRCKNNTEEKMVAFGIMSTGKLIGEDHFKLSSSPSTPPPPGGEQGHGVTLGDFKEKVEEKGLAPTWDEKVHYFFSNFLHEDEL